MEDLKFDKPVDPRLVKRMTIFIVVAVALLWLVFAVYRDVRVPLVISLLLSYALSPVMKRLEQRKIPRMVAALTIIVATLGGIAILAVWLSPKMYVQVTHLLELIPQAYSKVMDVVSARLKTFVFEKGLEDVIDLDSFLSSSALLSNASGQLQQAATALMNAAPKFLGGVVNALLVPLIMFYFLISGPRLSKTIVSHVPRDLVRPTFHFLFQVNGTLKSVLKGQLTVAAILGGLYAIGFTIVGLPSSLAIGLAAGVGRIVPYGDLAVGGALTALVMISGFQGWGQVLGVLIIFVVVQVVDGMYITPRVIGERVGLHPGLVIISVFAFGGLMGFWGVLLAIPILAVAKIMYQTLADVYFRSRAYKG